MPASSFPLSHAAGNSFVSGRARDERKNFAACALALALLVLAGCSNSASDSKPDTTPQATPTADSGTAAANGKTVSPLPSGIDLQHLNDCTVAVSFDKGDAFVDSKGVMQLKVKVYAYDAFDTVDINKLQVGDQITICQQNVKVTSLERDKMPPSSSTAVRTTAVTRWFPARRPGSTQLDPTTRSCTTRSARRPSPFLPTSYWRIPPISRKAPARIMPATF